MPSARSAAQLSDQALSDAADCLRTLAHPQRLRMVALLLEAEHTVGSLADACGLAPHAASQHLGIMRDRGLLASERIGREVWYRIAEAGLAGILHCVEQRFGGTSR